MGNSINRVKENIPIIGSGGSGAGGSSGGGIGGEGKPELPADPATGGGGGAESGVDAGEGAGRLPVPPPPTHLPSAEALAAAAAAIDADAAALDEGDGGGGGAPRRSNRPLYYFHPVGTPVYGTALLFHGFSGEPYGMRWVAHYLHSIGWNVYSTVLCGHAFKSGAWPKVLLKEKYGSHDALVAAVAADPALAATMANPAAGGGGPAAAAELFAQLSAAVPELAAAGPPDAYLGSLQNGGASRDAFEARFDSTAGEYGAVAEAALRRVEGLAGPIVTVGSSVGGAAALWLGGVAPGRVSHVLACAPLLRIHGDDQRQLALTLGPLGVAPEQGWSANNKFALSCLTANDVFGGSVVNSPAVKDAYASRRTKLFLMLTENEDAADVGTSRAFFASISDGAGEGITDGPVGDGGADGGHVLGWYPRAARVPHPMVDPTAKSQGMTNAQWASLVSEAHRFFLTGRVDMPRLTQTKADPALPQPPSSPGPGWP